MKYIIAIDQGTTGTTVSLIDEKANSVVRMNEEFQQIFPHPGWVEHRPDDIWNSVLSCIVKVMNQAKVSSHQLVALGITNQRETVVAWDRRTGEPVYNAIVWQCRRTTDFCEKLKRSSSAKMIRNRTGLVVDPYFSASKIRWIFDNVPKAKKLASAGQLCVGTIDSYLLWKLTEGQSHKTDVSNASRTQLMNIFKNNWDQELLKIFKIPESVLPEIRPSSGVLGHVRHVPGLPNGLPISGVAGDQQAALFGQAAFTEGEAKCTFGTGSFLLMNAGTKAKLSKNGLLTTIAWQIGEKGKLVYALEGGAFICGAAVQWLRDGLNFFTASREVEELARQVTDTGGVEFVPALTGLGAPHWRPEARGLISGLTRGTTKAHIARATLEAMALQNRDILVAMQKDLKKKLKNVRVDGGASSNNLLMRMQADFVGVDIIRPKMIETTSAGAAYLAGLGVGLWSSPDEIKKVWQVDQTFKPQMREKERKQRVQSWEKAIKRTL